jgi:60 kDa SS-A/Ro ribonucleoprotein
MDLDGLEYLSAKTQMHAASNVKEVLEVLETTRATWEMVPTQFLNEPLLWERLIDNGAPMTALMRNLGRLSKIGLLKPLSDIEKAVCVQLTNPEQVKRSRLHPYNVLVTQTVYRSGRGVKGGSSWTVSQEVVAALESTFEAAFQNIEPAGKRFMLAIDVSDSMTWDNNYVGVLQSREAAGAMSIITHRTEPSCYVHGFSSNFCALNITRNSTLPQVCAEMRSQRAMATDCAIPMLWAGNNRIEVDTFVIYTDNETQWGRVHPFEALKAYRQAMGIDAKLVVVAFTAARHTIADPNDAGMLDVVGFDSATPRLIADFAASRM